MPPLLPSQTASTWSTATPSPILPPTLTAEPPTPTTWPDTPTPSATPTPAPTSTQVVPLTVTPPPETATASVPPTPLPLISVSEGTIILSCYGWENALVGTSPDDPVYPYPRLDHSRVAPPAPRVFKTVILENEYVRLTFLPELGGRLYRWLDKPSGQEMFYVNPVIKPTQWGARGWWLATGGMEWTFPVEEHGLIEWRTWSYTIERGSGEIGITWSNTDDRTGLAVQVTVALTRGRSALTIRPRISNPTDREQTFQFWMNGMFALSPRNRPNPDLRFWLPTDTATIHSTGDGGLPGAATEISWPIYGGRDLSRYGNWNGWLGLFAPGISFMGATDPTSGMGVVRVFPSETAHGAKIFGPGTLGSDLWTDDNSGYVELWGGLTPTFWDNASLAPGGAVGWQETWYSINGLGGLSAANAQVALWLTRRNGTVRVSALTIRPISGQVVLLLDGQPVADWPAAMAPGQPFSADYAANPMGSWSVQVLDGRGVVLLNSDTGGK